MENDKLIFLEDYFKKTLENIIAIRVYNYILSENGKITIYYETYISVFLLSDLFLNFF